LISKAQIKDIKALHLSKFRQIYNKFIAEGDKVCIEFIKNKKYPIHQVFITEGNESAFESVLSKNGLIPSIISKKDMNQISALKTSTDIFLLLERQDETPNILLNIEESAIYLDGVQDPGNVGTIIRIADWFGIHSVIRSPDSGDFFNPKVVQSTMGSMINVSLYTSELSELATENRNVYGTYMEGNQLGNSIISQNGILVMGNEGQGISSKNKALITHKICIPGSEGKIADSLNVGIATGIICNHWKNQ
jgi:TrmH family RNA methyltransferase